MQHPRVLIRLVLITYNRFNIKVDLPIIIFKGKNTILLLSVIILKIDSSYRIT